MVIWNDIIILEKERKIVIENLPTEFGDEATISYPTRAYSLRGLMLV